MVEDQFDLSHLPSPRAAGNGHETHDAGPVGVMRYLASDLMSRANLAGAAGITFGGKRDLYGVLGYKRVLTPLDYRERYKRGGVAARIVEAFPDATWANGAEVIEDEDPEISTDFEEDFQALVERLSLWNVLHRADVLAGLGPFAVVLIGAPGRVEEPLPQMSSADDILYLQPFGPDEVFIDTYVENLEDPRFGLPLTYHVTRRTVGTRQSASRSFDRRVHWTRCVHVADGLLDDAVSGTPRLERVWNDLDNLDKVTGGGSEAYWLRVHQGYHWNLDKEMKVDPSVIEKLKEEAEEFEHGMRRTMATRGMTLTALGSQVSPFDNPVRALMSLISGATKIPQRILLGSERGELASTQDKENWNERVEARRNGYGTPLVRDFVGRLMENGALPEAEEYDVRWPEIAALTDQERAQVASVWAGLSSAAGGSVVTPEEIRDRVLRLDKLSPEQMAEMDAKEQAKKDEEQAKLDAPLKLKQQQTPDKPVLDDDEDPEPEGLEDRAAGGPGPGPNPGGGSASSQLKHEIDGLTRSGAFVEKRFKGDKEGSAKAADHVKTVISELKVRGYEETLVVDRGSLKRMTFEKGPTDRLVVKVERLFPLRKEARTSPGSVRVEIERL